MQRTAALAFNGVYTLTRLAFSGVDTPKGWEATLTPSILCEQAHIECVLTIEEETKDTCRQTLEGDVNIHIPGLGKVAESIIADSLKKVYSGIPAIVERWARSHDSDMQPTQVESRLEGVGAQQGVQG